MTSRQFRKTRQEEKKQSRSGDKQKYKRREKRHKSEGFNTSSYIVNYYLITLMIDTCAINNDDVLFLSYVSEQLKKLEDRKF